LKLALNLLGFENMISKCLSSGSNKICNENGYSEPELCLFKFKHVNIFFKPGRNETRIE
jgi:hypothetical protein